MKRLFFAVIMLAALQGTAQDKKSFSVNGNLTDIKTGTIILIFIEDGKQQRDTASIADGKFSFKGLVKAESNAALDIKDDKQEMFSFYLEPTDIKISGKGYPLKDWVISGSKMNADNELFRKALQPVNDKYEAFYKLSQYADSAKNEKMQDSLNLAEEDLLKEKRKYIAELVIMNSSSVLSAMAIEENYAYYAEATDVAPLYTALTDKVKASAAGLRVKKMLDVYELTAIGKMAPDIKQPDSSGNELALSSLKGKYILIDFWASWCGPCRKENPNVVKIFNLYKEKGFDIFGVSYDKSKTSWMKAVAKDGLTWNHVSDLQGWQNSTSDQYYIKSIPANLLLDRDGRIIAKNLFGKKLEDKLSALLN